MKTFFKTLEHIFKLLETMITFIIIAIDKITHLDTA